MVTYYLCDLGDPYVTCLVSYRSCLVFLWVLLFLFPSLSCCLWLPSFLSGFMISPGSDTIPSHDTCILSSDQVDTCFAHYFSRSIACMIFILYRVLQNRNSVSFQIHHSPLSLSALVIPQNCEGFLLVFSHLFYVLSLSSLLLIHVL